MNSRARVEAGRGTKGCSPSHTTPKPPMQSSRDPLFLKSTKLYTDSSIIQSFYIAWRIIPFDMKRIDVILSKGRSNWLTVISFMFFCVILALLVAGAKEASGKTLYVDDDGGMDFTRIQDAVNASVDGDSIRVFAGTYHENVVVRKSVSLAGNGSANTTIDGGGEGDVVRIEADWVNISGFLITGGGPFRDFDFGIEVEADHSHIFNNRCLNNEIGIYLHFSSYSKIENNVCENNKEDGIYLTDSNDCTITNNLCSANLYGIHLEDSNNCLVVSNNCSANRGFGIALYHSSDCTVTNNTSSMNNAGILAEESSNTIITDSSITLNGKSGIYLTGVQNTTVRRNEVSSNNNDGIYLSSSSKTSIMDNNISANGKAGLYLYSHSPNTTVQFNNIFSNTIYGIRVDVQKGSINATWNWWGHDSGAYHPVENPRGKGDNISYSVEFEPWLGEDGTITDSSKRNPDSSTPLGNQEMSIILLGGVLGIALILGIAMVTSESLRFSLHTIFLPLYTRLNEEKIDKDITQQNIRGQIYTYIGDNPGSKLTSIKEEINAGYGTTVYHLSVLQREGFIRSATRGRKKLFWMKQVFPGGEEVSLTEIQKTILELLKEHGEMSRMDLLEKIDVPMTTLHYNLKELEKDGKVREEKLGSKYYYSLAEMQDHKDS